MVSKYASASSSMSLVSFSTKYEPPSGSTTSVTPLSCAMICCVRSASVAAFCGRQRQRLVERVGVQRVGRRRAPPPAPAAPSGRRCCTAAARSATRRPSARGTAASTSARSRAPKRSRIACAQSARAARYLAISSKKSLCALKKNDMRGTNVVDVEPGVDAPLHVLDAVAQRERQLLRGGRARFADVVAADRDRVPRAAPRARRTRRCR